jgi:hypothetical protein
MSKPTYVVPPLCVSVEASATLRALRFGQIKQPRLPLPAQLKSVTTHPPHVLVSAKVLLQGRRAKGGFSFGAQAFHAKGRFHQAGVNARAAFAKVVRFSCPGLQLPRFCSPVKGGYPCSFTTSLYAKVLGSTLGRQRGGAGMVAGRSYSSAGAFLLHLCSLMQPFILVAVFRPAWRAACQPAPSAGRCRTRQCALDKWLAPH